MFKITVHGNGDIEPLTAGWVCESAEGCAAHVLSNPALELTIVVMCTRLENGEPWLGYVLPWLSLSGPEKLAGGCIDFDEASGNPIFTDFEQQAQSWLTENATAT